MKTHTNPDFWQPKPNITFEYPILMWYGAKWVCHRLKVAQMEWELRENVIYKN